MVLYTVIASAMNGRDAIAVFSTPEKAKLFLENNKMKCKIEEYTVRGKEPVLPKSVYASHEYKRTDDIHYFIALFWDFDEAKKVGGENSLVTNLDIDGRL